MLMKTNPPFSEKRNKIRFTNFSKIHNKYEKRIKKLLILYIFIQIYDIMSAREPEQAQLVPGERRMSIMRYAHDIMSAREPEQAQPVLGERRISIMSYAHDIMSAREPEQAQLVQSGECQMLYKYRR